MKKKSGKKMPTKKKVAKRQRAAKKALKKTVKKIAKKSAKRKVVAKKVVKSSKKASPKKTKSPKKEKVIPASKGRPKISKKDKNCIDKLIAKGKAEGKLTYDEVNASLPDEMVSPKDINNVLSILGEENIEVIDEKEALAKPTAKAGSAEAATVSHLDDPVKMYLKQMGQIPLLTREEEISLAQKIEKTEEVFRNSVYSFFAIKKEVVQILERITTEEGNVEEFISVDEGADVVKVKKKLKTLIKKLKATRSQKVIADIIGSLRTNISSIEDIYKSIRDMITKYLKCESDLKKYRKLRKVSKVKEIKKEHQKFSRYFSQNPTELKLLTKQTSIYLANHVRAKRELTSANLRLVVSIAKKYTNRGLSFLDLIQEGNIGLMKAVDKFEYKRGYKFSTYATWWIRQAITRSIADQSRTIRIPVHMTETINKLIKISRSLVQEKGQEPTPEEIAQKMRMAADKVRGILKIAQEPISLQTPIGDEGDTHFGDFIEDKQAVSPANATAHSMLKEQVDDVLDTLTEKEKKVLRLRFGIGDGYPRTLEEVGKIYKVTRERVRQIESKALKKLRHPKRIRKLRNFLGSGQLGI